LPAHILFTQKISPPFFSPLSFMPSKKNFGMVLKIPPPPHEIA